MKFAQATGVQPARDIEVSENVRSSRLNLSPSGLSTGKKATSGQNEKPETGVVTPAEPQVLNDGSGELAV